jgi:hypothetical protein
MRRAFAATSAMTKNVSRRVRIARSTVKEYLEKEYLDRAAAVGLNWETVAELSEEELADACSRPLTRAIGIVRCLIGRRSRRSCVAAA